MGLHAFSYTNPEGIDPGHLLVVRVQVYPFRTAVRSDARVHANPRPCDRGDIAWRKKSGDAFGCGGFADSLGRQRRRDDGGRDGWD